MVYHGACHQDFKEALDYIKEVRSQSTLVGMGISLGGNILANVNQNDS